MRTRKVLDSQMEEMDEKAGSYYGVKGQIEELEGVRVRLRMDLLSAVNRWGGQVATPRFNVSNIVRTSSMLNEERAKCLLNEKNLLGEVEKTRTYLDEDAIDRLVDLGELTREEVRSIYDTRECEQLHVRLRKKR